MCLPMQQSHSCLWQFIVCTSPWLHGHLLKVTKNTNQVVVRTTLVETVVESVRHLPACVASRKALQEPLLRKGCQSRIHLGAGPRGHALNKWDNLVVSSSPRWLWASPQEELGSGTFCLLYTLDKKGLRPIPEGRAQGRLGHGTKYVMSTPPRICWKAKG
jgi:hypothetical protein